MITIILYRSAVICWVARGRWNENWISATAHTHTHTVITHTHMHMHNTSPHWVITGRDGCHTQGQNEYRGRLAGEAVGEVIVCHHRDSRLLLRSLTKDRQADTGLTHGRRGKAPRCVFYKNGCHREGQGWLVGNCGQRDKRILRRGGMRSVGGRLTAEIGWSQRWQGCNGGGRPLSRRGGEHEGVGALSI